MDLKLSILIDQLTGAKAIAEKDGRRVCCLISRNSPSLQIKDKSCEEQLRNASSVLLRKHPQLLTPLLRVFYKLERTQHGGAFIGNTITRKTLSDTLPLLPRVKGHSRKRVEKGAPDQGQTPFSC
ncbi:hypothetical protein [Rhizobium laguerreae]